MSEKQANNQTNKVLASIPKETIEKAIKEKKILLLNIRDEKQRLQYIELINNLIVNPKNKEILGQYEFPSDLETKTIPCQYLLKNEIIDELEKFVDNQEWIEKSRDSLTSEERPKHFNFYTLHIKDLRESDYDNTVAVRLQRLIHTIQGKEKRNDYIKLITSSLEKINKTIKDEGELFSTVLIQKVKGCDDENIQSGNLKEIYKKEIDKNEITEKDIEKYHNNIQKYGTDEIGKIIEGIKLRKNEKYKLIMEGHFLPPALVINFKDGTGKFRKEFQGEYVEIPPLPGPSVNDILHYDCKEEILFYPGNKNDGVHMEPQEKNLLYHMSKTPNCRLEDILFNVFEIDIYVDGKIKREDRRPFDTAKSEINKKCRDKLGIEELITKTKGFKKTFKLSKKIVFLK